MIDHKTLAEALAAFQGDVPVLHKGSQANAGSFSYKYIDLADVVSAIQPLMREHGLSFSAFPCNDENGRPALRYKLSHVSGDCESSTMALMLSKADAQAHGSAITYARRYALCSVLNLVADADDDGQAAKAAAERERQQRHPNGATPAREPLPDEALTVLATAIRGAKKDTEWLRSQLVAVGAESVPDGPVMKSTLRALTADQARELVRLCDAACEKDPQPHA